MKDKTILITGGTGSLGQALVSELFTGWNPGKVIVFSRSEHPQVEMERIFSSTKYPIRYFLGDIRDRVRLAHAFQGVDYVLHAAAVKHVDKIAYNPREALTTNVMGTMNVAEEAMYRNVEKVLNISSDKAVSPVNLYGASKLCADEYLLACSVYDPGGTKFSTIRFGNFHGSRGSVVPHWQGLVEDGKKELPITDKRCTRFFIMLEDAARLSLEALEDMEGGEIYSPKMEAYRIKDLARELFTECELVEVGLRPGERLHEPLLTGYEGKTYDCGKWYITTARELDGAVMPQGTRYSSTGLK